METVSATEVAYETITSAPIRFDFATGEAFHNQYWHPNYNLGEVVQQFYEQVDGTTYEDPAWSPEIRELAQRRRLIPPDVANWWKHSMPRDWTEWAETVVIARRAVQPVGAVALLTIFDKDRPLVMCQSPMAGRDNDTLMREVRGLFVDEAFRNKGVATMLLKKVLEDQVKIDDIFALTVNPAAAKALIKAGYYEHFNCDDGEFACWETPIDDPPKPGCHLCPKYSYFSPNPYRSIVINSNQ